MVRAVIDTNVLVSSLLSPSGAPGKVFDHVLNGNVAMCYDANIMSEYREVLNRPKFRFNSRAVDQVLDFTVQSGVSVVPAPLSVAFTDEDDKVFYEVAVHAKGYLVTGNAQHYPKDPIVVSVSEFLSIVENRQ